MAESQCTSAIPTPSTSLKAMKAMVFECRVRMDNPSYISTRVSLFLHVFLPLLKVLIDDSSAADVTISSADNVVIYRRGEQTSSASPAGLNGTGAQDSQDSPSRNAAVVMRSSGISFSPLSAADEARLASTLAGAWRTLSAAGVHDPNLAALLFGASDAFDHASTAYNDTSSNPAKPASTGPTRTERRSMVDAEDSRSRRGSPGFRKQARSSKSGAARNPEGGLYSAPKDSVR
jgi:hypothetical protein